MARPECAGRTQDKVLKMEGPARLLFSVQPSRLCERLLAADWSQAKPEQRTKARGWQLDRTNDVLRAEFPNGVPPDLTNKEVRRRIEPVFKKNGWKLASVDTIARAHGRR